MASAPERATFSNSALLILSCLGNVVGTGNIWRFPRICALNSFMHGALCFLIIWALFVPLWSMPLLNVELGLGRYFKAGPPECMGRIWGRWGKWTGVWIAGVTFFLSAYYYVIEGWCLYYLYRSIAYPLPINDIESRAIFTDYTENSYWSILTMAIAVLISGVCAYGGIKWIEKANLILMPTLLLLLIATFIWSLTLPYSEQGITFLLTPTWSSMGNPRMWIDAASQIAFDTGAGMGTFLAYGSYFKRSDGVVKYATFLPLGNNLVSLVSGFMVFSTVFSTLIVTAPSMSTQGIIEILKTSGLAGTGVTFIWMPVLMANAGVFGRILCVIFFFCLTCAGVSSTISGVELCAQTLADLGLRKKTAVIVIIFASMLVGTASGASVTILTNQDFVWGFGIIVSGLYLIAAVSRYGVFKFRRNVINNFGINDFRLPWIWAPIIQFLVPLEAMVLLVWWIYDLISGSPGTWYHFGVTSITTTMVEWLGLFLLCFALNAISIFCNNRKEKNSISPPHCQFDIENPPEPPIGSNSFINEECHIKGIHQYLNSGFKMELTSL